MSVLLEIHGTPVLGHEHKFQYHWHGAFSCDSKCECGALHISRYSPDGNIGGQAPEVIYELDSCYFKFSNQPCNDKTIETTETRQGAVLGKI